MSLEARLSGEDMEKYKDIFNQLDPRSVSERLTRSFQSDNDGGLVSVLGAEYASYLNGVGELRIGENKYEEGNQIIDGWLLSALKIVDKDMYASFTKSTKLMSAEDKRQYLDRMAESALGMNNYFLSQFRKDIAAHGKVDQVLHQMYQMMTSPDRGLLVADANRKLAKEFLDFRDAQKMLGYFEKEYLEKKGYSMDDVQRSTLPFDQQAASDMVTKVIGGNLGPDTLDRYQIRDPYMH